MIAANIHVLTSMLEHEPHGCTVAWVTQVSASQVLVSVGESSATLAAALSIGRFALSSLAEGQERVARQFGANSGGGADKFDGLMTMAMANGCPAIAGSVQALGCDVERAFDLDGQVLLVGRVRETRPLHAHRAPLSYDRARYFGAAPARPVPAAAEATSRIDDPADAALTVRLARGQRPERLRVV